MTRSDEGFTLTEMLVALLVISLSLAGLFQIGRITGRYQQAIVLEQKTQIKRHQFQAKLWQALHPLEPITDEVTGSVLTLSLDGQIFKASDIAASFSYISDGQSYDHWPIEVQDGQITPRLEAISLLNQHGEPIGILHFKIDHAKDCQFDMLTRQCRTVEGE